MTDYNPGIESLFGFYYQIKTFVSLLANIYEGQSIGYEYLDDVSVLDDIESNYCLESNKSGNNLYQVKKTNVDEVVAKKVLYNWLLSDDAESYCLIVSNGYACDDSIINKKDIDELYNSIEKSQGLSLSTRVYNEYKENNKKDLFLRKVNYIRERYTLLSNYDCDLQIFENYKKLFHYDGDKKLYERRIRNFLDKINTLILESVQNKKPYIISFLQINAIAEEICNCINADTYEIDYNMFCEKNFISLRDEGVKLSREYVQLKLCNLNESVIINRLKDELYYLDFRSYWLERNKTIKIRNIENSAVSNFEDTCIEVKNNDLPIERYSATIKKEISNTNNKMQSNGVYISLTNEADKRISWKDE